MMGIERKQKRSDLFYFHDYSKFSNPILLEDIFLSLIFIFSEREILNGVLLVMVGLLRHYFSVKSVSYR